MKPEPKPAGVGGQVAGSRLTKAPGAGAHPLAVTVTAEQPEPFRVAAGRPRTAPKTRRTRTTLYVDEELLRELGRVTARLTVERDEPLTKTSVLEAALRYGLQHVDALPADAFPVDARRTSRE